MVEDEVGPEETLASILPRKLDPRARHLGEYSGSVRVCLRFGPEAFSPLQKFLAEAEEGGEQNKFSSVYTAGNGVALRIEGKNLPENRSKKKRKAETKVCVILPEGASANLPLALALQEALSELVHYSKGGGKCKLVQIAKESEGVPNHHVHATRIFGLRISVCLGVHAQVQWQKAGVSATTLVDLISGRE